MNRWQKELERVRAAHKGRLHAKDIVAAARSKVSPLHDKFEWDNTRAAQLYRLEQAAELIREVTFLPADSDEPVRTYVSLSSDRIGKNGYRAMADVLSDADLTKQLLADALAELEQFSTRYDRLKKIASMKRVFRTIEARLEQRTD